MANKLSDREWEAWADFLTLPLAQALFQALAHKAESDRCRWAERLWAGQCPDPADPSLQAIRQTSLVYRRLSELGQVTPQTRAMLEELLHDPQSQRDKPD